MVRFCCFVLLFLLDVFNSVWCWIRINANDIREQREMQ